MTRCWIDYNLKISLCLVNRFLKWKAIFYRWTINCQERGYVNIGGRGTFAAGNDVPYTYETVGHIEGVKVLKGLNGRHSLPEEAHSSSAYIRLKPDGTFHEMRFYDEDHYLVQEIAYHPEPNLNNGNRKENILHIHEYQRDNFKDRTPRFLTDDEIEKYKKYLKGVNIS